jgi:hypothetical protein
MNHFISLQTAIDMTGLYRSQKEKILKTEFQGQKILPLSEQFERAPFDRLLEKASCEGLRIYYGMSEDLKIHAIIVATDKNGNDILPAGNPGIRAETADGDIIELSNRCPDICPEFSPLNS